MRKLITAAGIVVRLSLLLLGLSAISAAESPRAVIPETNYDFGTVKQGEKVSHVFVVRNEGSAPLNIQRVDLSMPGMTARFKPVIPSGEEGRITVEWNTGRVKGEAEGEATVRLDDPAQPQVTLILKGSVKSPIDILPYAAVFFSVFKGESVERNVTIVNNEERPLGIKRLEPDGQHFAATLETVKPGKVYRLLVKVPPEVPPGRYREAVYLHTDHPTLSRLTIPINVFVKADLYASPEVVDFGQVSLDQLAKFPNLLDFLTQTFLVKKRQGDFEIKSIVSDPPFLHITQSPSGRSGTFRIDVGLIRDRMKRGKITGSIRLLTNDRDFPELVIPVQGEVR